MIKRIFLISTCIFSVLLGDPSYSGCCGSKMSGGDDGEKRPLMKSPSRNKSINRVKEDTSPKKGRKKKSRKKKKTTSQSQEVVVYGKESGLPFSAPKDIVVFDNGDHSLALPGLDNALLRVYLIKEAEISENKVAKRIAVSRFKVEEGGFEKRIDNVFTIIRSKAEEEDLEEEAERIIQSVNVFLQKLKDPGRETYIAENKSYWAVLVSVFQDDEGQEDPKPLGRILLKAFFAGK